MQTNLFHAGLKDQVKAYGSVQSFPANTRILGEAQHITRIPIVLKGSLRVMRTDENGQEILLYYIRPGESCIMSFLGGIHHEASKVSAETEEETEILLIPVEKAGEWIREFPEWTDFIFKLYHKRFEELLSVVNAIAFRRLDERVLLLLRQKAELLKTSELIITHQQIADELGSSREVISRIVKQMENQGQIKLSRNKITLM
ncbi:MAG TPA: Crp/Fnr family transcriptional regulator [Cyclobacteriaceae bacterium]|nr:Crp/Fnr family transcriptional regulator [Cyclobacteriaceae bacterium]